MRKFNKKGRQTDNKRICSFRVDYSASFIHLSRCGESRTTGLMQIIPISDNFCILAPTCKFVRLKNKVFENEDDLIFNSADLVSF